MKLLCAVCLVLAVPARHAVDCFAASRDRVGTKHAHGHPEPSLRRTCCSLLLHTGSRSKSRSFTPLVSRSAQDDLCSFVSRKNVATCGPPIGTTASVKPRSSPSFRVHTG